MRIICEKGQYFELQIQDYEYPYIEIDKKDHNWFKDSNWLNIFIKVKQRKIYWNAVAPILNIYDVRYLIDWFNDISDNKIVERKMIDFIEPELSFVLLNNVNSMYKIIKIRFSFRFNPACIFDHIKMREFYYVKFKATNNQLKKYAKHLEEELLAYPER